MNKNIATLEPVEVWKHFYEITQIPRPSKNEAKASEFMASFGQKLGLETIVDKVGNVIIRKPAVPGMENTSGVILQSHLDMVPQKNNDKVHNFETDPITAFIDGEWVTADGTTLGADNGMGVAATMAVLESKTLKHGPIEALFTIDEETGMTGAQELKPGLLKGKILINLDSEDEGELYVGCAGGLDGNFTFNYKEEKTPENSVACKISLTGLKGGHSGMDIALGRGNANKLIIRLLKEVEPLNIRLASIAGGNVRNAIPREAFVTITIPETKINRLAEYIEEFEKTIKSELQRTEPDLNISMEKTELPVAVMDSDTQSRLIDAIYACPNGVIRMSDTMHGLVETSTNLAIVKNENGKVLISCLLRSSVDSAKEDLAQMMQAVFTLAGAECKFTGGYPGWKPNPDSAILTKMKEVYQKLYGKIPEVKAIHAGLECGLLGGTYPEWDMISCGPTIRYPHSPDEKVKIETVGKWWKFLTEALALLDF
ncbi:MAG: aminoacyl-histidine dipeptidase [Prevotellaceae bacterium]|jgi:dipeptidase D|nr:aminoacyl-histidine dipeptidase [Prevotellaceae bacterium]